MKKLFLAFLLSFFVCSTVLSASQTKHSNATVHKNSGAKVKQAGRTPKTMVQYMRSPPEAILKIEHDTELELGCLESTNFLQIKDRLQLPTALIEALSSTFADTNTVTCQPYSAAVTKPIVRNALALLSKQESLGELDAVIYSIESSEYSSLVSPFQINAEEKLHQIMLPNLSFASGYLLGIPAHLQWEIDLIAKHMMSALNLEPLGLSLRITLMNDKTSGAEKVFAIELLESENAKRIECAIWLDRDELPGAYFSLRGLDYERLLWQSPVKNARISRGVGPSVTSIRRSVSVKTRKKSGTRTVIRPLIVKGQHIGIDFSASLGTPVVAVADGEIMNASVSGGYGKLIIVDHGNGYHTYYAHLSAYASEIKPGILVRRGEEIGFVGSTGFSTGPHLHFEIRKEGQYIDPAIKKNKLQFWTLDISEQSKMLTQLLRLHLSTEKQTLLSLNFQREPS